MLEAILRIERYAARGEEAFRGDELIQSWMVQNLQVIGEATRVLSQEFRDGHPDMPWSEMIGMRHVLVHEYFGIDLDIVWRVVSAELPMLKRKIDSMLRHPPGPA